ncbi:MAG: heparinase II/III family protein [Gammaproteobacteria bacterium]
MTLVDVGRYWRTLRHLPLRQLAWLAWRRVLRQPRRVAQPRDVGLRAGFVAPRLVPLAEPCRLGPCRFRFLDHTVDFAGAVDWAAGGQSRLWQYNLHYFEWLRQADVDAAAAAGLVDDWISANPPFGGTGWEPYTLALRVVNWTGAIPADGWTRVRLDSFALQTAWLLANLEHHIRANHLLADIKGLLFAGALLDGEHGRRLLARGQALLRRELPEQFLRDGGHYERSPMYHLLVTRDLVEIGRLMAANPACFDPALRDDVERCTARALACAADLVRPDGEPAAFNDSAGGVAPRLRDLLDRATTEEGHEVRIIARADSGYYGARRGGDWLLLDCGPVAPDYQPGHTHCDLLAFELCLDGRPVVVNCGVYDYTPGPRRTYVRSTAAHNTLSVDGAEQSEVWGAFRVGRRARPLAARLELAGAGFEFAGSHDGFRVLPGCVTHERRVVTDPAFAVITITDRLTGSRPHAVNGWLHVAPGLVAVETPRGIDLSEDGRVVATIGHRGWNAVELRAGERHPRFGQIATAPTLAFSAGGELPLELQFEIRRGRGNVT